MEVSQGMKIHHQFARGFWDHEPPSLTLGCKRFRPLAPKFATTTTTTTAATFDLKSFIRPESTGYRKIGSSSDYQKKESTQVDQAAQPGGTRWNPTQEQIGILEMLYRSGMRTPNAQQIEQITVQLAKYSKIEGKNVFYWFQNHKARERQKQKRNNTSTTLGFIHSPRTPPSPLSTVTSLMLSPTKGNGLEEDQLLENSPCKRKCRSCAIDECSDEDRNISYCTEEEEEVGKDRTLKLFPLHPEGRS